MPNGCYPRRALPEAYLDEPFTAVRDRMEALVLHDIERECEERDWQIKQYRRLSRIALLERHFLNRWHSYAPVFFGDHGKMELNRRHRYAIPKAE